VGLTTPFALVPQQSSPRTFSKSPSVLRLLPRLIEFGAAQLRHLCDGLIVAFRGSLMLLHQCVALRAARGRQGFHVF
jgi:hypothetical protein